MAKLTALEIAQKHALNGDIPTAMVEFLAIEKQGDARASAALAELSAFQHNWSDTLNHAQKVLMQPQSVSTLNVYWDMLHLIGLSGLKGQSWSDLQQIALSAGKVEELREGYDEMVDRLETFAAAKGKGEFPWSWDEEQTPEQRQAQFESAVVKANSAGKKRFPAPGDRRNHIFSLAKKYKNFRGAVELYDLEGPPDEIFSSVVFTASSLVRANREDEAWQLLKGHLHLWWPVEVCQVAPVELLFNQTLAPILSKERCMEILKTPRGSQVQ